MDRRPEPVRYRVAGRSTVLDVARRRALGLDHWPDGTVGTVLRRGRLVSVGANGTRLARAERAVPRWWRRAHPAWDTPFGTVVATAGTVDDVRDTPDYLAGGPLFYDRDRDLMLLVYHAETHRADDPQRFYATLGLAASSDGGATFRDLGRIVRPEIAPTEAARIARPVEVGPGSLVALDDRFVVVFHDFRPDGRRVNLAAASADRTEVLDAAARGRSVRWAKFDGTGFSEPALGGRAEELMPMDRPFNGIEWSAAAPVDDGWILVGSTSYFGVWSLTVSRTTDGVSWSAPTVVNGSRSDDEGLYVSASAPLTAEERAEAGPGGLLVHRVLSATGGYGRWDDARLERLVLRPD